MLKKAILAAVVFQGVASAMCGNFWVAGEALLLRPSGAYPYNVIIGPRSPNAPNGAPEGDQVATCPSYEWGYKVELGYRNCDKEILINWLSYNNAFKGGLNFAFPAEQVWVTSGASEILELLDGGTYRSADTFKYDALDAEVAKWMCKECSRWSSRLFLGLRYARICHNHATKVLDTEQLGVELYSRSDLQGTGPRVGFGARWELWCNFGLTASVAGHLLIGSAKSQFYSDDDLTPSAPTVQANVKNRKYCRILPASEVKFGVDWRACLTCGFAGEMGIGYQISHYFYGDQSTLFTQATGTATNHVHTDPISFDGWYFRIGLMY